MFTRCWLWTAVLSLIFLRSITTSKKVDGNDYAYVNCHRKLQPGKKTTDPLVERMLNCRNVRDCCQACEYEKAFACKGFNYRRGTDGSKDTCELTSTPYFRMNLDRDFLTDSQYDYYERDRNCVPSAWQDDISLAWTNPWPEGNEYGYGYGYGYGYAHDYDNDHDHDHDIGQRGQAAWSRFGPKRERQHPLHQSFVSEDRQFAQDFSDGSNLRSDKPFPYENRRDFVFRQNGRNWNWNWNSNGNWQTPESNPPRHFSIAEDNSIRDTRINHDEDHGNPKIWIFPESRHGNRSRESSHSLFPPHSTEKQHFHGKLWNYGSAFGYGDTELPDLKRTFYAEEQSVAKHSKCSIRIAVGSKLTRGTIRKSCLARDSKQCEDLCIDETTFLCGSFAYRYNVLSTNPTDNCLLSDLSYRQLSFYKDLEPDRDYDSYVVIQDSVFCYPKDSTTNRNPSEECFSRVRSGFTIPSEITKKSMSVNDLGECQLVCTMSQEFVCRSLAFKYTTDYHDQERVSANCFLTDWPPEQMNPVNMPDMDGAELYERSSFTFGCEPYPLSLPTLDAAPWNDKKSSSSRFAEDHCYSEHRNPCKLMSQAVVSSMRTATESECRRTCSAMRKTGSTPCMSFAYTPIPHTMPDNCFFSDISIRDLRPNLDYTQDDAHVLYTWNDFDPYCRLSDPTNTVTPMLDHHQNHYPRWNPARSHGQNVFDDETRFGPTSRPRSQFGPENYEHDSSADVVPRPAPPPLPPPNHAHHHPPSDSAVFDHGFTLYYPREHSTFRRYTVNGNPCKNGTVCQRNEIAGFWSCETEYGEHAGWDYCCEPNHRCGFSRGYHYPWCYVGSNEDQWRPCSEIYYPYHRSSDPSSPRQSTEYSARHWPIIYLHETSPPNCTIPSSNDASLSQTRRRLVHHGK